MYFFSSTNQLALATALFTIASITPNVSAAAFPTLVPKSADAGVNPTGSVSGSLTIYEQTGTNAWLKPTGALVKTDDAGPGTGDNPSDTAFSSSLSSSLEELGKIMTEGPTPTDSPAEDGPSPDTTLDSKSVTATTFLDQTSVFY